MEIARLTDTQRQEQNERVRALEDEILKAPQVDLRTENVLNGKVNARTIRIPAGTVLTGAMHNLDAINIVCGDITVTTDEGTQRFTGYHVIPSKAGAKRAGVAHCDTIWTTLWHTELTDLASIEDEMTDESAKLQSRLLALSANHTVALEE